MDRSTFGYGGKIVFPDGSEKGVRFYQRYFVEDLGEVVDFYVDGDEKYRFVSPFKRSNDPDDGYLPHRYYKSTMVIDKRGKVTERWDLCVCWTYFD